MIRTMIYLFRQVMKLLAQKMHEKHEKIIKTMQIYILYATTTEKYHTQFTEGTIHNMEVKKSN